MDTRLLLLELNEINFDHVQYYCARGQLPVFDDLISRHGVSRTTSESKYEALEPWIQWVTAHTGMTLAEHGVFRLGDIVNHDIPQIWERLEAMGLRVGAVSPMNAKLRLRNPAFFLPDPWTKTGIVAPPILKKLYQAVVQAVNDNADGRITVGSAVSLLIGAVKYALPRDYGRYLRLALGARTRPWRRAMFLDLLLANVFVKEVRRTSPHFASLFLNAGAHIQHHYMFSAAAYQGDRRNPAWYVAQGEDPVLEIYRLYDHIVGSILRAFPRARVMLATGLHQDPHGEVTFYWRLRRHADFLRKIGVPFVTVEPRMSRDFVVVCESPKDAQRAERILGSAVAADGAPLFEVDNRGRDLFVMLTYPRDIPRDFVFRIEGREYDGLRDDVAFVAIKNGQHNGIGYFLDTHARAHERTEEFALTELPGRILDALTPGRSVAVDMTQLAKGPA